MELLSSVIDTVKATYAGQASLPLGSCLASLSSLWDGTWNDSAHISCSLFTLKAYNHRFAIKATSPAQIVMPQAKDDSVSAGGNWRGDESPWWAVGLIQLWSFHEEKLTMIRKKDTS